VAEWSWCRPYPQNVLLSSTVTPHQQGHAWHPHSPIFGWVSVTVFPTPLAVSQSIRDPNSSAQQLNWLYPLGTLKVQRDFSEWLFRDAKVTSWLPHPHPTSQHGCDFHCCSNLKYLNLPPKRKDFSNIHPANSIWDPPNKLCSACLKGRNYKNVATGVGKSSGLLILNQETLNAWKHVCQETKQGNWVKYPPRADFSFPHPACCLRKSPWGKPSYSPQKPRSEEHLLWRQLS
jgi:hypothetical protein